MTRYLKPLIQAVLLLVSMIYPVWAEDTVKINNQSPEEFKLHELSFTHHVKLITAMDFAAVNDERQYRQLNIDDRMELAAASEQLALAQKPAAVYLEFLPGGKDLHVVFFNAQGEPKKVLTVALSRRHEDGGGFSSFDEIDLIMDVSESHMAQLVVTKTSLPGKRDRPFMPGPPLGFVYIFDVNAQNYVQL